MHCHGAVFDSSAAKTDEQKYESRVRLQDAIRELDSVLKTANNRFKAAQNDLRHTQSVLRDLDINWKEDLVDRISHRPPWIPNEFARNCSKCRKRFSIFVGRHHCRSCGLIFCDPCTGMLPCLPNLAYFTQQRVCLDCQKRHEPWVRLFSQTLPLQLKTLFPDLMF